MLTIYHSNKLDVLKSLMAYIMDTSPLSSPFEKEIVVVQSQGMAKWLQIELSKELGILANVEFPLPSGFFWRLFNQLVLENNTQNEVTFDKLTITWWVMKVLPSLLSLPEFNTIARYLQEDDDQNKKHQLALKCADVFDHYLVYRPHWMLEWEKGQRIDGIGEVQDWQAILWQTIIQTMAKEHGSSLLNHRASMYGDLVKLLEQTSIETLNLPKRIFICGICTLPPLSINVLEALGKHIDVHIMYTNPSRHYWADLQTTTNVLKNRIRSRKSVSSKYKNFAFNESEYVKIQDNGVINALAVDLESTHPLLANWGKLAKEQLYQFAELTYVQEIDAFVEESNQTVLGQLKADILHLQNRQKLGVTLEELSTSQTKVLIDEKDDSISLHVCHSMVREVEVLQDYLLAQFEQNKSLEPKDVIVMVSDITLYAPYILAIFGNAPSSRYLPFSIADRSVKSTHSLIELTTQLLHLPKTRFTVEEVLRLISSPALLKKFDMSSDELEQITYWIEKTHIYWGRDDEWVQAQELPAVGQYTWRFGLERMLLGLLKNSESGIWQEKLAYDGGQMVPQLLGKFCELIEALMQWQDRLSGEFILSEWQLLFNEMLDDLVSVDKEDTAILLMLIDAWNRVIQVGSVMNYEEPITLNLLVDAWLMNLENTSSNQPFLAGKINFCTLMPMRSIPFKQVCLLGMSESLYPRKVVNISFDLMKYSQQIGDRSRRDDDKYLFLESILSAEQKIYISYVGISIATNEEKNPSMVVNELLDYLTQSYVIEPYRTLNLDASKLKMRDYFITVHPRVPYSLDNFLISAQENNEPSQHNKVTYLSFAKEWFELLKNDTSLSEFNQSIHFPESELNEIINLDNLVRFYSQPVDYFFKVVLGLYFNEQSSKFQTVEPFQTPDSLEFYELKKYAFDYLMAGKTEEDISSILKAQGGLPANAAANKAVSKILKSVRDLHLELTQRFNLDREILSAKQVNMEINLSKAQLFKWMNDLDEKNEQLKQILPLDKDLSLFERIEGWLVTYKEHGLVEWRVGSYSAKYYFTFWIKHLLYCLCLDEFTRIQYEQEGYYSTMIGVESKKNEIQIKQFRYIDKNSAALELLKLIKYFYLGHKDICFCLPDSCAAIAIENGKKQKNGNDADNLNDEVFQISMHDNDKKNVYVKRVLEQSSQEVQEEIDNKLHYFSGAIFSTLFEYLEK
ncbi:exodeoxyribonuclease V subunit gamma [Thorsellia kenyensis]|uniref:RecBCD enzyme subunit RecC n=1 Tax=Thorsellia kenyensis TaxID=1549888 RepID=A0ABV6CE72_9GAMM